MPGVRGEVARLASNALREQFEPPQQGLRPDPHGSSFLQRSRGVDRHRAGGNEDQAWRPGSGVAGAHQKAGRYSPRNAEES